LATSTISLGHLNTLTRFKRIAAYSIFDNECYVKSPARIIWKSVGLPDYPGRKKKKILKKIYDGVIVIIGTGNI